MRDMEEETDQMKANEMRCNIKPMSINSVILRISVSVATMVLLIWAIENGFQLARNPTRYVDYTNWAFGFGIVTMLLGFMFLLLGIPILADLVLNFSHHLQQQEAVGFQKALEAQKLSKTIAGICAIMVTMVIVLWAVYVSFRLATESNTVATYVFLSTSIGFITIVFGVIYLLIGISVVAKLGLDLFKCLQYERQKRIRNLISKSSK